MRKTGGEIVSYGPGPRYCLLERVTVRHLEGPWGLLHPPFPGSPGASPLLQLAGSLRGGVCCRSRGGACSTSLQVFSAKVSAPRQKGLGVKTWRGGRNGSAVAGIHLCFSGNCEATEMSCSESKAVFAVCDCAFF